MGGIKLPFPPADPLKGHPAAEKTMVNATARRHAATLAMDFCGVSQSLLNEGASCRSSWLFQPIGKKLVKGANKNIRNHHLVNA